MSANNRSRGLMIVVPLCRRETLHMLTFYSTSFFNIVIILFFLQLLYFLLSYIGAHKPHETTQQQPPGWMNCKRQPLD